VGEAVDPGRAVGSAHDLGDAAAVSHAFERVGQRLALVELRVSLTESEGRT
jgi:hypothetical protein